jgi:hypothetical protein
MILVAKAELVLFFLFSLPVKVVKDWVVRLEEKEKAGVRSFRSRKPW